MTYGKSRRVARRLKNPAFFRAILYWILRRLTGIQVHDVYAIELIPSTVSLNADSNPKLTVLRHLDDFLRLPDGVEQELNEQSGHSCRALVEQGNRVYAATEGQHVACQLNIRYGEVAVDSPSELIFTFAPDDAFLNYLHTRDDYRGRGLAGALLSAACDDLAKQGKRRCIAHIRATNYISITAFRNAGWKHKARIVTTTSGRLLATPNCRKIGMLIQEIKTA